MDIQVTPDSVERERVGSIRGNIKKVSAFPVTLAEAERVIGNRELAEALTSGGYRMQIYADLTSGDTPSGFEWTSSRGPDLELTAGTTTTARVVIDSRPPITFVLPFLRRASGVE